MLDDREPVPVRLPNGAELYVELRDGGGAADVAALEDLDLDRVREAIEGVAELVHAAWDKAAPRTATVEFGLALKAKPGRLAALLVDGSADASLKVSLTWGS